MLVRIVKMTFKKENIASFEQIFKEHQQLIRAFEGCSFLELYQDRKDPAIFFTYSYWDDETYLERYRKSTLFKTVWAMTKKLFSERPQAWSVDKIATLN